MSRLHNVIHCFQKTIALYSTLLQKHTVNIHCDTDFLIDRFSDSIYVKYVFSSSFEKYNDNNDFIQSFNKTVI